MPRLASRERLSFSRLSEVLELPDLIAVQRESFQHFLDEGIAEVLADISPIEDFTGQLKLELSDHVFDPPKHSEDECRERDMTFARPLFVTARFMNATTGEIKEQTVFMGDFPMMTDRGTFIINGTERIVVSQLVRSPGVYFDISPDKTQPEKDIVDAKMIPGRGAWLEFEVDKKDIVYVRIDRKRKQPVTILLKALGFGETDEELLNLILDPSGNPYESMRNTLDEGQHRERRRRVHRHLPQAASRASRRRPTPRASCSRTSSSTRSATTWPRSGATRCRRSCRDEYEKLPLSKFEPHGPERRPREGSGRLPAVARRHPRHGLVPGEAALQRPARRLLPRRHRPLRQPPGALGRRAHPEPGARRALADGAGRPRAHDHPGRRGDHARRR